MPNNALFEPAAGTPAAWPDNRLLAAPPSMADAYEHHAQALQQWMAEQRASGVAAGTNDPETGWPTQKGIVDGVRQWGDAMIAGTNAPGFRAYHGSPHAFDKFDLGKIGTGEGAQAYGHGLYFADEEKVARGYRDTLSANTPIYDPNKGVMIPPDHAYYDEYAKAHPPGHMYEVQVNADPAHFLDWDKPRDQLAPNVQAFAKEHTPQAWENAADGSSLYHGMAKELGSHAAASEAMAKAGVPGIRYLDGGSRADGAGTSNHVIFDPATIEILRKYGIAGLIAGGGAAAAAKEQ